MHEYQRILGDRVKEVRNKRGLTQVQLAERIQSNKRTILDIEVTGIRSWKRWLPFSHIWKSTPIQSSIMSRRSVPPHCFGLNSSFMAARRKKSKCFPIYADPSYHSHIWRSVSPLVETGSQAFRLPVYFSYRTISSSFIRVIGISRLQLGQ